MKSLTVVAIALLASCATMQQRNLTDSEIAMVMRVANLGEVREGELARSKATDTAVRVLARQAALHLGRREL